jgi:hypothetical protein
MSFGYRIGAIVAGLLMLPCGIKAGETRRFPGPANVPDLQPESHAWKEVFPGSIPYKTDSRSLSWRYATAKTLETWKPPVQANFNSLVEIMSEKRHAATGYFRTIQDSGRWWFVDPEGRLFLSAGVNAFRPAVAKEHETRYRQYFTDEAEWATKEGARLRTWGFNTAGCWSNAEVLRRTESGLAYTIVKWPGWEARTGPLAAFSIERGIGTEGLGNRSFRQRIMPVFHPDFPVFVEKHAPALQRYKNDKRLLGYFLDNELPPPELQAYLNASHLEDHLGAREAAESWLKSRGRDRHTLTSDDKREWPGYVFEEYCRKVVPMIRKHDPNHLILGPRLHARSLNSRETLQAVGRWCDVICIHPYGTVIPGSGQLGKWLAWTGRPIMITECYAKGADSGMENSAGAGVTVPTQEHRGLYYQGVVMACLASRGCIGWHWHQYQDLENGEIVPSYDVSANKGLVRHDFTPYQDCVSRMMAINSIMYGIAASHLDTPPANYGIRHLIVAALLTLALVGAIIMGVRAVRNWRRGALAQ